MKKRYTGYVFLSYQIVIIYSSISYIYIQLTIIIISMSGVVFMFNSKNEELYRRLREEVRQT